MAERLEDANENKNTTSEIAYAVVNTNRTPWADFSVLFSLTPERLASILRDVRSGECPATYLELAQDMELKDPHYRSVISTRKDAVCGLDIKVTATGDSEKEIKIAKAVERDILNNKTAKLRSLVRDMLDGNAKGFSVNEIIWDTSGIWKPKEYKFRDQRWFQYNKETGTKLMLRSELGNELYPLNKRQFIIYEPHLISGLPIVSGLAFPALFYWMLKNYNVTSWAAFIDRYGFPIRIGKYGSKATPDDIKTLKRAVANIGADFGAVIPESAILEIVETKSTGDTSEAYQKLATWVDKQISKLVLGQTMTTDEGSSRAQSQTHEEIRDDIADADVAQVNDALNTQLVIPYIDMNFGQQEEYPVLELYKPDEKNIDQVINAVEKLGPLGLTVPADEVRNLIGMRNPDKQDAVIGGIPTPAKGTNELNSSSRVELNAIQADTGIVDELLEESSDDYTEISQEIAEVIEQAAERATSFSEFKKELTKLIIGWKPDRIAELMAVAFFKARSYGDSNFDKDEE